MKILKWILFAILYFGVLVYAASAQTASPIIGECGKKGTRQFTVRNNGTVPLVVTVEAKSSGPDILFRCVGN